MSFYCTTDQFEQLLNAVSQAGYTLLGPKLRDQVIIYDTIESAKDLPIGWTDEQDPGRYRLKRREDQAYFGYNLGPHSWKKFLFPPREKLYSVTKQSGKLAIVQEEAPEEKKMAFIGVRACEIRALDVLDKVFNTKLAVYQQYRRRRDNTLIIAVNCTTAVNTCFCASMQAGPHVKDGYDLSLTEVIDQGRHYFLLKIGSERGKDLCKGIELREAAKEEADLGHLHVERTIERMIRKVDHANVHDLLENSHDYKRWDEVASRCINCANCTNSCPTCFCSDTEDIVSLDGGRVDRWQSWESCFNLSHSYIHGGSVRTSAMSRYRQWLTHKFGTWWDQFGVSGCVGCGRCITWCPVGIDVTEELKQLQVEHDQKNR